MKKGVDHQIYIERQSKYILERVKGWDKLYLEFGGKLMYDLHAKRCLPGYRENAKLELLQSLYPQRLEQRYKLQLDLQNPLQGYELLERIGRSRGMLVSGGEINTERAAITVLDEYRGGKLGPITLELA